MTRALCALALVLAGCGDDDGGGVDIDAGGDPPECDDDNPCSDGVCSPDGECVACLVESDCAGDDLGLVCSDDNACVSCTASAQCSTEACVAPGGRCAAAGDVAYVAADGAGTDCSLASPCGTLNAAIATDRPFILLRGEDAIVDTELSLIEGKTVTISGTDGNGALSRSMEGPVIEVRGGAIVTFTGIEIRGGLGATGHGLDLADAATTVTLDRVVIRNNTGFGVRAINSSANMDRCVVVANANGGVTLTDGAYHLTNNLFVNNGSGTSPVGGVRITAFALDVVFEFNTVANNLALAGADTGVDCQNAFPASSNIVTGNVLDPNCTFTFSLFDVATPGTGNLAGDPLFLNTDPTDPGGARFYRIDPFSPAVDAGDPDGVSTIDIDGETRPAGGRKDMGADEAAAN